LVTGAAGHVGGALVRELLERGEKVRVFVLPNEDTSSLNGMPLDVVKGNVLDRDTLRTAMEGISKVFHLAGIISIMPGHDDLMRQVNVVGSGNVARVAREAGVKRMVYVSSIHALARPRKGIPINEGVPFDPHNAAGEYDQTKAEASLAVLAEVEKGLDAVIVCPTGIIGPYYLRGGSPMHNQIRKWMKPGLHVMINGQFDFVDVRDVARGMALAAENGRAGETYIIRGERITVRNLLGLVQKSSGVKSRTVLVPMGLAMLAASFATFHSRLWKTGIQFTRYALETLVSNSEVCGEKASRELGYLPRPMRDTISDTVKWLAATPAAPRRQPRIVPAAVAAGTVVEAPRRPARVAVVTGASSGIGSVVAERLAIRGFKVFLVARREDRLASLAQTIREKGGLAEIIATDLSQPQGVRTVYERIMENGEGINVLVNNAGFGWYGFASDMHADTAREMVQVNNEALAQLIILFLPIMRGCGRGHIINVSSIVGGFPSPWAALYSATKSFIDAFTTALHRELRGSGVHVSAVRPGPVVTEFYQTVTRLSAGRSIPVGKSSIRPEVVADAIMSLLVRPRRAMYVPRKFGILPWVELGFGWLYDRIAGLLIRHQGSQA
jgi:dihydroflavonol-4-reductase